MSILNGDYHFEVERRPGYGRMVDHDSGRETVVRELDGDVMEMEVTVEGERLVGRIDGAVACLMWLGANVDLSGELADARKTEHPWAWILGHLCGKMHGEGERSVVLSVVTLPEVMKRYYPDLVERNNFVVADVPFMPHCPRCGEKLSFGRFGYNFGDQFRCEPCRVAVNIKDHSADGSFASMTVACDPLDCIWPAVMAVTSGGGVN